MATLNFEKMSSDRMIKVNIGPSGGSTLGITDIYAPTEAELNNVGGTSGMQPASQTITWATFDFGTQESETLNEPSLADSGSYTEYGASNFGGSMGYFMPASYDDNSNLHSIIYDLTDEKYHIIDVAKRVDGEVRNDTDFEDGDFVSTYRVQSGADANPFNPGESVYREVTYNSKSDFAHYTVVGPQTITLIPPATDPWDAGTKARLRASQGGRDTTNRMTFTTSDATVVQVYPGGFYEVTGSASDTATITVTAPDGTSQTQAVTVA